MRNRGVHVSRLVACDRAGVANLRPKLGRLCSRGAYELYTQRSREGAAFRNHAWVRGPAREPLELGLYQESGGPGAGKRGAKVAWGWGLDTTVGKPGAGAPSTG